MTQAIAKRTKSEVAQTFDLTDDDVKTLVAVGVIPAGTTKDVITFFSKTCSTMKLSPFKKQIHLIARRVKTIVAGQEKWDTRYSIQTGIDGYRSRADSTGRYAGNDDYVFDAGMTEFQMIQAGFTTPETATSTVYKIVGGVRCPFSASARWKEYCPADDKQGFMWRKMPFLMLGKTAEALALRKAFPNETAGVYVDEEMAHIQEDAPSEIPTAPASVSAPVASVNQPPVKSDAPPVEAEVVNDVDWKKALVPFGKHKGKALGDLEEKSLKWYCENFDVQPTYVKDGKTLNTKPEYLAEQQAFRDALDDAAVSFDWTE